MPTKVFVQCMLFRKLLQKEKKTQDALDNKTTECRIIQFCRSVTARPEFSVRMGISTQRRLKTFENFKYEPTV